MHTVQVITVSVIKTEKELSALHSSYNSTKEIMPQSTFPVTEMFVGHF